MQKCATPQPIPSIQLRKPQSPVFWLETRSFYQGLPVVKVGVWLGVEKVLSFRQNPGSYAFFIEYTPITGLCGGVRTRGTYPWLSAAAAILAELWPKRQRRGCIQSLFQNWLITYKIKGTVAHDFQTQFFHELGFGSTQDIWIYVFWQIQLVIGKFRVTFRVYIAESNNFSLTKSLKPQNFEEKIIWTFLTNGPTF